MIAKLKSLEIRLLIGLFAVVIGSSLAISILGYHLYKESLIQNLISQALRRSQSISLEATDKILINDIIGLQKLLLQEKKSHPEIAYLVILRKGALLAHTFDSGVPEALVPANAPRGKRSNLKQILSKDGPKFLDVAWPIFEERGGVLRLGLDEQVLKSRLYSFWVKTAGMTAIILSIALTIGFLFIRRSSIPLNNLTQAVFRITGGEVGVRVPETNQDEIGLLSISFNRMLDKIENYTVKLENQTDELEKANAQTRLFCHIVQEVGSMGSLKQISAHLIDRFSGLVDSGTMALIVMDDNRELLYVLAERNLVKIEDASEISLFYEFISALKEITVVEEPGFMVPSAPDSLREYNKISMIPLPLNNRITGILVLGCGPDCRCEQQDLKLLELILSQASGVLQRAVHHEVEMDKFRDRFQQHKAYQGIIGKDHKMEAVFRLIEDVAPTDASVLIEGESGTGKELVARAIYKASDRRDKPFVVINCSAYPITLLESEIFGHGKGAFTGAVSSRLGRFEIADGGTVFLDEIGEIPPSAQVKLLRVLQTHRFERLGGNDTISVDIRILAATNKQLLEEVKKGTFREDLYYRLNIIQIQMPPLRSRKNDIPILVRHFLEKFNLEQGKEINGVSPAAMRVLLNAPWYGNVRELENAIEHAVILAKGQAIELPDLPSNIAVDTELSQQRIVDNERTHILNILVDCNWNKAEAARRLGISRSTLYKKIKRYHLSNPTDQ